MTDKTKGPNSTKRLTIEQMQKLGRSKNYECLSKVYKNNKTKLTWLCFKHGPFEMAPSNMKNSNQGCPKCGDEQKGKYRKLDMNKMNEIAKMRGGKCLSTEYKGTTTKLKWQCAENHKVFEMTPHIIMYDDCWCPDCAKQTYRNENITRKLFEHIFGKKFPISKPKWLVNSRGNRMELDGLCQEDKIAFEYHGQQHYHFFKRYHKGNIKFLVQRKEDDKDKQEKCKTNQVKLIEIPYTIPIQERYEYIIRECKKKKIKIPPHQPIKDITELSKENTSKYQKMISRAKEEKGKCLSHSYITSYTKYEWQCKKNHKPWLANYKEVVNNKTWCPECAKENRHEHLRNKYDTHGRILAICKKNKWTLKTKKISNSQEKIEIICKEGHKWYPKAYTIIYGHGCGKCSRIIRKKH